MQFFIDDDTHINGKLEVGATATVEYRANGANNVAQKIIVQHPRGE
jgi:hypothetical protein